MSKKNEFTQEVLEWKENHPHAIMIPKSEVGNDLYNHVVIGNPFRSVGIFGGAGSGKTESLFKPIITHAVNTGCGVLMYDYKSPELAEFLKAQNPKIPVYHVDFNDPINSAKVNPIAPKYITNNLVALELAQALYYNLNPKALSGSQDPFWDNSAISIIQATIWYLKEHATETCNIPTLIDVILRPIGEVLDELRKDPVCAKLLASVLSSYDSKATNLLASISSTVQSPLGQLIGEDITHILSADETPLDINNLNEPCILIVGTNQDTPQAYSPLISLIITSALRVMNKPNKHPSYFIGDEAPTIYIPKIEDYPAVTRSRKISFIYGAQDISQIDKAYGKERREALLSNLANQFFGRSPNKESLQYVCALFGKTDIEYRSNNMNSSTTYGTEITRSSSGGEAYSIQQRDVLQPTDILNFGPGQFAFIGADSPPRESKMMIVKIMQFGGVQAKQQIGKRQSNVNGQLVKGAEKTAKGGLHLIHWIFRFFTKIKID